MQMNRYCCVSHGAIPSEDVSINAGAMQHASQSSSNDQNFDLALFQEQS